MTRLQREHIDELSADAYNAIARLRDGNGRLDEKDVVWGVTDVRTALDSIISTLKDRECEPEDDDALCDESLGFRV